MDEWMRREWLREGSVEHFAVAFGDNTTRIYMSDGTSTAEFWWNTYLSISESRESTLRKIQLMIDMLTELKERIEDAE